MNRHYLLLISTQKKTPSENKPYRFGFDSDSLVRVMEEGVLWTAEKAQISLQTIVQIFFLQIKEDFWQDVCLTDGDSRPKTGTPWATAM